MRSGILFIANNNIGTGFSGGDRIFTRFLNYWKEREPVVLMGSEEAIQITKREGVQEGVEFIQTDSANIEKNYFSPMSLMRHLIRRTRKGTKALQRVKPGQYRVVYSVSDFYPDFWPAYRLKRKDPEIIWVAGYYLFAPSPFSKESPYRGKARIKGLLYWLMQRYSYSIVRRYADFVFVTSEPDVKKFITSNRDASRIPVIQGGVDIEESEKYLNSSDVLDHRKRKYHACFMGRLHPQKGVLPLVHIWRKVVDKLPEARLALIGDGELESKVRQEMDRLNLTENIDLLGFRDGGPKFEIFKNSQMMVHPAVYDSGGMAAAEGMAWALPGVSFDLVALETYYPKGMLKAKKNDLNDFAEKILALLTDEKLYQEQSRDARDLIVNIWNWEIRATRFYQLISDSGDASRNS